MKKPTLSLRGIRIGVLYCESKDQTNLEQQFRRLGIEGIFLQDFPDFRALAAFDILMFDSDHTSAVHHSSQPQWPDLPRIAVLGTETPSRLQWVINQEPSGYIRKPVKYEGVLSACILSLRTYRQSQTLNDRVRQLEARLAARKFVFSALLILMKDLGLNEDEAYVSLRTLAMSRQLSLEQMSIELAETKRTGQSK
ncbi:ANTAR domain-containing response regulator [Burkholderia sp. L27(2015)]|uniref:ANTAR domain-containing response regulator n=1 Tax=Burkholderia sp. L27(2015) TaxID=1641858 RepID=UPI00131C4F92|nr:ANTAR domain-containing protein [Burkholderia sp. L27(2015)]